MKNKPPLKFVLEMDLDQNVRDLEDVVNLAKALLLGSLEGKGNLDFQGVHKIIHDDPTAETTHGVVLAEAALELNSDQCVARMSVKREAFDEYLYAKHDRGAQMRTVDVTTSQHPNPNFRPSENNLS